VNFTHHGLSYGKNINGGGSIAEFILEILRIYFSPL
jgi:hypothetical protein